LQALNDLAKAWPIDARSGADFGEALGAESTIPSRCSGS
jgi:hypothetical protein